MLSWKTGGPSSLTFALWNAASWPPSTMSRRTSGRNFPNDMSSHDQHSAVPSLDLSKWRSLPTILIAIGGLGTLAAFAGGVRQFAFTYLVGFMFALSLGIGGLFL